jgi:hypothetical protein
VRGVLWLRVWLAAKQTGVVDLWKGDAWRPSSSGKVQCIDRRSNYYPLADREEGWSGLRDAAGVLLRWLKGYLGTGKRA